MEGLKNARGCQNASGCISSHKKSVTHKNSVMLLFFDQGLNRFQKRVKGFKIEKKNCGCLFKKQRFFPD